MESYLRALIIPSGAKADAAGRTLGDDWPIARIGRGDHGEDCWITTDQVNASWLADLPVGRDAVEAAKFISSATSWWMGGHNEIAARVQRAYAALCVLTWAQMHGRTN